MATATVTGIHSDMATDTHFSDMDTVSDIMATRISVMVTDSATLVAITNRNDDIMDSTIRKGETSRDDLLIPVLCYRNLS